MVVSWSMFTSKDITKAKALKFPQKYQVSMIEAVRNKEGSLSFTFRKKIKGKKSPVGLLIEKYYEDKDVSLEAINVKVNAWVSLCNKGIHPREEEERLAKEEAEDIQRQEDERIKKENDSRTFRWVIEDYNMVMLRNEKNNDRSVNERMKAINAISPDWWDLPIKTIDYDKVSEAFNIHAYQKDKLGYAKNWARNLIAVWNRAVQRGYADVNPFIDLKDDVGGFSSGNRENNYLLVEEANYIVEQLDNFESLDRSYSRGNQLQALKLLLYTGIRLEEALALQWDRVYLDEVQPYIHFPKGTRKQKDTEFALPILSKMKDIFIEQQKVKINNYVFPSYKNKESYITDINFALKILKPPSLDTNKNKTMGNKTRVESFTAITLRRTWGQIGLDLGYPMATLNFVSGRSKTLDSQGSGYKSYVSQSIDKALPFYKEIIGVIEGTIKVELQTAKDKKQDTIHTAEVVKEVVTDLHRGQEDKDRLKKQDDNVIQKLLDFNMQLGRKRQKIQDAPEAIQKEHRELETEVFYAELRNKIRSGHKDSEEMIHTLKSLNQPLP